MDGPLVNNCQAGIVLVLPPANKRPASVSMWSVRTADSHVRSLTVRSCVLLLCCFSAASNSRKDERFLIERKIAVRVFGAQAKKCESKLAMWGPYLI